MIIITTSISLIVVTGLFLFLKKQNKDVFGKKKDIFHVFTGILLVGALYAILFPKTFALLGTYQPPIGLNDFSIVALPLALIGFSAALLHVGISIQFLFLSLLILMMLNLPNVNIAFPQFRLLIYCLIILSYGAAKGFKVFCYTADTSNAHRRVLSLASCLIFIFILTPFVAIDITAQRPSISYFTQYDVDSANAFTSVLQDPDIIIPQGATHYLLRYVGVDENQIYLKRSNFTIDTEIYEISEIDLFVEHVLSEYPDVSKIFVFIIENKIDDSRYYTPSITMLESFFNKQRSGTIVIYSLDIV